MCVRHHRFTGDASSQQQQQEQEVTKWVRDDFYFDLLRAIDTLSIFLKTSNETRTIF